MFKTSQPLAPLTTFKVGGEAEYFVEVRSEEELEVSLNSAKEMGEPVTILGGGSNVLLPDAGVKGLTIKIAIGGISYQESKNGQIVTVGAGVSWDELVKDTTTLGYWGFENLSGIPGTVGGAIVQNINAYGVTVADLVETVEAINIKTGQKRQFSPTACRFAYRDSLFKHPKSNQTYVITKASFRLSKIPVLKSTYRSATQSLQENLRKKGVIKPTPDDLREAVLEIRARIGMLAGQFKGAGSFFTNPIVSKEAFNRVKARVDKDYSKESHQLTPWHWLLPSGEYKISAAFLMECTPYNKTNFKDKDYRGVVGISPLHSLSVINLGEAKAKDVKDFVSEIKVCIKNQFGIELTSEVCVL